MSQFSTTTGIKGFAITPVVLGRIGIGEIVEQGSQRLPRKLNHIVLTGMSQQDGAWREHPEMARLVASQEAANSVPDPSKLRSIPVRIMFDKADSNFRAGYTCFDNKGRPICAGNGEDAQRATEDGIETVSCPGSDHCAFGQKNRCKQFARLIVAMESTFKKDPLSGFMFRTTGFNSIRALTARLDYFAAACASGMAGMQCNLVMRAKSTAASYRKPIFYLDLEPAGDSFIDATKAASDFHKEWADAGLDRAALEDAVTKGLQQSAFFEIVDDGQEVVDEFFLSGDEAEDGEQATGEQKAAATTARPAKTAAEHPAAEKISVHGATGNAPCTAEQVTQIETLLIASSKKPAAALQWLGKAAETPLSELTHAEAQRVIAAITPPPAKDKKVGDVARAAIPTKDAKVSKVAVEPQAAAASAKKASRPVGF